MSPDADRSEAARKAWRTRRAKDAGTYVPPEKAPVDPVRRAAALKAWDTIRAKRAAAATPTDQGKRVGGLFAWVPWFRALALKIATGGPEYLVPRAKEIPWSADGQQAGLLNYGDDNIDPFSFFYFLASKNDTRVWKRVHDAISQQFSIGPIGVTPSDGFYFPTPPGINALFHSQGDGKPQLLWRLFKSAAKGLESTAGDDFEEALTIRGTKIPKLTQALFLVNPDKFLPCDAFSGFAVCGNRSAVRDWKTYRREFDVVRSFFPGCQPYEINMVSYLFRMKKERLKITNRAWQSSTLVDGDQEENDYWDDFRENGWIYHRGPGQGKSRRLHEPVPGDLVFVRTRASKGRGIAVVYRNDHKEEWTPKQRLHVLWLNTTGADVGGHRAMAFSEAGKWVEWFRASQAYAPTFALLQRLGWNKSGGLQDEESQDSGKSQLATSPPDFQALAENTLISKRALDEIWELLDDKKQIILQGPPGTGKTYLARELAKMLAGSSEGRVRLVQFHPSYSYEDFVQGFRPTLKNGQAGFELRDGPLIEMARRATEEPDARHFLVIDEINRGNLSKVLGELYFLLEYRDQKMRLQYSDEPFLLPGNLYIIGTMNTADRSIAILDLALRRRFSFVEFHPDKPPIQGLLGEWLKRYGLEEFRWLEHVLQQANEKLHDRHAAIGPSYFMPRDKKLDEERIRRIWEHNVLPYIEEHLFGQSDPLAEFNLEKLRGKNGSKSTDERTPDSTEPADANA